MKLDSYYYDDKLKTTIVVLKFRNKRSMQHFSIKNILLNNFALKNLHPIDLCTIGILSNSLISQKNLTPVLDNFSMARIDTLLEIVGSNFNDGEEILTVKLKFLNKTMNISANELYNNKALLNALKYQDALSLGYSVSSSSDFEENKIINLQNLYPVNVSILNGLFSIIFFMSVLLTNKSIYFSFAHLKVQGNILLLPFLIFTKNIILEKYGEKYLNCLLLTNVTLLVIFLSYYGIITKLPYPPNDFNTNAFNSLFAYLINKTPYYIMSILLVLSNFYLITFLKNKFDQYTISLKNIYINYFDITLFFLCNLAIYSWNNKIHYTLAEYFYSLLMSSILHPLLRNFFNKSIFNNLKSFIFTKCKIFLRF